MGGMKLLLPKVEEGFAKVGILSTQSVRHLISFEKQPDKVENQSSILLPNKEIVIVGNRLQSMYVAIPVLN
jgi:hypothetical protein